MENDKALVMSTDSGANALMLYLNTRVLFCWHVQQRSVAGLVMTMWGVRADQMALKLERQTASTSEFSHVNLYLIHTETFVMSDGRSDML